MSRRVRGGMALGCNGGREGKQEGEGHFSAHSMPVARARRLGDAYILSLQCCHDPGLIGSTTDS